MVTVGLGITVVFGLTLVMLFHGLNRGCRLH
jgi:hypothetical protein